MAQAFFSVISKEAVPAFVRDEEDLIKNKVMMTEWLEVLEAEFVSHQTAEGNKEHELKRLGGPVVKLILDMGNQGLIKAQDETNYQFAARRLVHYFTDQTSLTEFQERFRRYKQEGNETVVSFSETIRRDVKYCEFGDDEKRNTMRSVLVNGIADDKLRQHVREHNHWTFDDIVKKCSAKHSALLAEKKNASKFGTDLEANFVHRTSGYQMTKKCHSKKTSYKSKSSNQPSQNKTCGFCGKKWHNSLSDCPARQDRGSGMSKCNSCGIKGHWAGARKCKGGNSNGNGKSKGFKGKKQKSWKKKEAKEVDGDDEKEVNQLSDEIGLLSF